VNVNPSGPQNLRPDGVPSGRVRPEAAAARDRYQTLAGSGAAAQSDLSSRAQDFVKIRRDLDALPVPSRADRIAELRALIGRGGYVVGGAQIADAMLRDHVTARALGLSSTP
jgi:anti-sigma28 factor (negative regulator of flagellin synthesis)